MAWLRRLLLLLLFPAAAFGQGMRYDNFVLKPLNTGGLTAVSGALITVCTSAGTGTPCTPKVANIYSDEALATPILGTGGAGTMNSDSGGNFGFYLAPGSYIITVTGTGITSYTIKLVLPVGTTTTNSFKYVNRGKYASQYAGTTCADKITAAAADVTVTGPIYVDQACGLGTGAAPWAALTIPANTNVVVVEQGTYNTNNISLGDRSQLISAIPCAPGLLNLTCPVTLKQGNGLNLPSYITVPVTSGNASIQYINIDGNKANNPTGGPALLIKGQSFYGFYFITQNSPSHGTMYSSTGIANQACCTINIGHFTANNNGDGVFSLNTADGRMESPSYQANGICVGASMANLSAQCLTPTATVNTSATTVTGVGISWSTDSSLVGTHFFIGNGTTTWYDCIVGAIPSTTTITLGTCIQVVPMPVSPITIIAAGGFSVNTGWAMFWGSGDEYNNSPTWREVNHDHGGNMRGHSVYATTGSVLTSNGHPLSMGQFGNQFTCDICYFSDGTANGSANLTGGIFSGIQIQPTNANRIPTNIWSNILMVDGGAHEFDMTWAGGTAPHQLAYTVSIGETSNNRYYPSLMKGIVNTSNTTYGSGTAPCFTNDLSAQGSSIFFGNTFCTSSTAGSANAVRFVDNVGGNSFFARSNNGNVQFLTNAFTAPATILPVTLFGATTFSSLTPLSAAQHGIGTGLLPYSNLVLGTAATNAFTFTPPATAAARAISWTDPLGAANWPFTNNTSTTTTQVLHATATAGLYTTAAIATADEPSSVVQNNQVNTGGASMTLNMTSSGAITPSQTNGIVGTTTNNNANAGSVGEYVQSVLATGSSVTLATGVTSNVTSISLTAGDWDVTGAVDFTFGATTSYTNLIGSVSTTTGTIGGQDSKFDFETPAAVPTAGADSTFPLPVVRFSLSGTTTVFLVAQGTFTVSTLKAYGTIRARRVR